MPAQQRESAKPQYSKSLNQGVAILLDELRMAQKWNRPALLIAACKNHLRLYQARAVLRGQLHKIIDVNAGDYGDRVALHIANHAERGQVVFFVSNIANVGADGRDVFRALNMHREYFIENMIRVVFWLGEAEAAELPRHAIDFWAFRHRVVELAAGRFPRKRIPIGAFIPDQNKVGLRALREYERGQIAGALSIFEDAIKRDESQPLLLANAALIEHALGRNQAARHKMMRALSIEPGNARLWLSAGYLYLSGWLLDDAQFCLQKALEIEPTEMDSQYALAVCYFFLNRRRQSADVLRGIENKGAVYSAFAQVILGDSTLKADVRRAEFSNAALEILLEGIERIR